MYAALGEEDGKICRELFSYEPNGLPGDEDNGTMAAWYVFSTLGFYPICPGKAEYVRSKINGKLRKYENVTCYKARRAAIVISATTQNG